MNTTSVSQEDLKPISDRLYEALKTQVKEVNVGITRLGEKYDGDWALQVGYSNEGCKDKIPSEFEGIPVVAKKSGIKHAY